MSTTRPAPLCQVRVIATTRDAAALLAHFTEQARRLFGSTAIYHTQTRSARRTGHVRAYLTITAPVPSHDRTDRAGVEPRLI